MNKSESISKLAEALSKAQASMKHAVKDSDNPFFKSKYADLASVSDAAMPELTANGLAVTQLPEMRDGKLVLTYVLMHSSGEWISGELEMNPAKSDPQGIGSAITYARRYTLAGLAGVATEDDDGNAASGKIEGQQKTKVKVGEKTQAAEPPPPPKPNGKPEVKGIAEGQRTNFKTVFEKALRPERKKDAAGLYVDYIATHNINFDTMDPNDFFGVRDEAERYAKSL